MRSFYYIIKHFHIYSKIFVIWSIVAYGSLIIGLHYNFNVFSIVEDTYGYSSAVDWEAKNATYELVIAILAMALAVAVMNGSYCYYNRYRCEYNLGYIKSNLMRGRRQVGDKKNKPVSSDKLKTETWKQYCSGLKDQARAPRQNY